MKKLFCLAILCFGFVGCSGPVGTPEERAKTMGGNTPTPGATTEGTPPAGDAAKEGAEAPKDPAPAATEAAEVK